MIIRAESKKSNPITVSPHGLKDFYSVVGRYTFIEDVPQPFFMVHIEKKFYMGMNKMTNEFSNSNMPAKEAISQILVCYDLKPNIPFRHIECDMGDKHIEFIYKTYTNYGNSSMRIRHRYTLYIGTKRASEEDLKCMIDDGGMK